MLESPPAVEARDREMMRVRVPRKKVRMAGMAARPVGDDEDEGGEDVREEGGVAVGADGLGEIAGGDADLHPTDEDDGDADDEEEGGGLRGGELGGSEVGPEDEEKDENCEVAEAEDEFDDFPGRRRRD